MVPAVSSAAVPLQGFWEGPWEMRLPSVPVPAEVDALEESDGGCDDGLAYGHSIRKRVYGVLERGDALVFERVRTSFDLIDAEGRRSRFYVNLCADGVGVLWVGGVAVRQVWVGYVRCLAIPDLVRAVPEAVRVLDALRDDVDRDLCVCPVRTLGGAWSQEVEVLSVAAFLERAAALGLREPVGGAAFWTWASVFPEALPHVDLMRFRRHDPFPGPDRLDHAFLRPGDSAGASLRHPFRAAILSCFPFLDRSRTKDGLRPVPVVSFAAGEVAALEVRARAMASQGGRALAVRATAAVRPLVPFLSERPVFEGVAFETRHERGAHFVWLGSIEDACGVVVPEALSRDPGVLAIGAGDDPTVFLRRNVLGRRGRSARTTLWVRLDALEAVVAVLRHGLGPDGDRRVAASLEAFASRGLEDLETWLLEGRHGVDASSPTRSGRQVVLDLVIDGVSCPVVFDPYCREPWFTLEQAASVLQIGFEGCRSALMRARARAEVEPGDVVVRMGRGPSGRLKSLTFLSWDVVRLLASATGSGRGRALRRWEASLRLSVAGGGRPAERSVLSDFEGP